MSALLLAFSLPTFFTEPDDFSFPVNEFTVANLFAPVADIHPNGGS
jgi:hypothetical protein